MVLEDNECDSVFEPQITEEHVETQYGTLHCVMTGTPKANRPVILTFHDIGLNHKSCFSTLFNHEDMDEISKHLPVCHVEAPGQHEEAKTLPSAYTFPTMDQLSETLPAILKHFGLKSVIGLGVGAGAYILAKFALNHPDLVDGLVLININPCAEGLMDSVANKLTEWTHTLPDTIISHVFGKEEIETNHDLIATYRHHISTMNQSNVSQFLRSYNNRTTLEVERPIPGGTINVRTLKLVQRSLLLSELCVIYFLPISPAYLSVYRCSTLLIVGDSSPVVEAVVECNSKLNPTKTTLLKMADCGGVPLVDQPAKVIEAFKYFIQGMGYSQKSIKGSPLSPVSSASMTRLRSRTTSSSSISSFDGSRSRSHTNELQRGRTHSRGEEKHGRSHTDVSMESISNSTVDQIISKSTEVAC
ncbi:Protein NDRG1-A [Nibea albiflora]|uniref:Protein NDRG1-A n=1 Tax=Nibea albiflora TaxID=240163 RepID=A0ACB7FAY2_NIBAL|nr:Protein NDRG1-A [Nibea albiflora]